jgi:hypothetical protein
LLETSQIVDFSYSKEETLMSTKFLLSVLVLFALLASCNMPAGQSPVTQPPEDQPVSLDANAMATAVELTAIARVTQIAGSAVPATPTFTATPTVTFTPTTAVVSGPCSPLVTANVVANVRSGPDTAYDVVGSLGMGQTATIVGRNDAYTWWYIDYPGVAGNHAWIAGSVVTSSCVPAVVQVVAAPPLPTPTIVVADDSSDNSNGDQNNNNLSPLKPLKPLKPLSLPKPDLFVSEFTITPATPIMGQNAHVRIGVYNQGKAASGQFTVVWYGISTAANASCSWAVDSLPVNGGRILQCDYAFPSWYPANKTSVAIVDANSQVSESNEGNNQGTITPFGVAKP